MTESRRVPADAVIISYAQCEMIRLLAEGADRADASDAGWQLLGVLVHRATGMTLPPPGHAVNVPSSCLAESAAGIRDAYTMDWDTFRAAHPEAKITVTLPQVTVDQLAWLADCVIRAANGVEVLAAARQAHDTFHFKPRQRRKPAEPEWLTGQIAEAETVVWQALYQQQPFKRPAFGLAAIRGTGLLPSDPPAATVATTEGR